MSVATEPTEPSAAVDPLVTVEPFEPLDEGSVNADETEKPEPLPASEGTAFTDPPESPTLSAEPPRVNTDTGVALPRLQEQFEALTAVVLDAADVANQSAQAAADAGLQLKTTAVQVGVLTQGIDRKTKWALGVTGGLMLVSAVLFSVMTVRMISRVNQLDATVLAVGKRAVELGASLQTLDSLSPQVAGMLDKQEALAKNQTALEARLDAALQQSAAAVKDVPERTAKQVASTSDALSKQVQGLNGRLQSQAAAVQTLGKELEALKLAVTEVSGVKRDVQSLVTLQRERYLELLQKQTEAATSQRALQYPRPGASAQVPAPATSSK